MSDMKPQMDLSVTVQDGGLMLRGPDLEEAGAVPWVATQLDGRRYLVTTEDARLIKGKIAGFTTCGIGVFKDFLLGLHQAGWSGLISADTGYGVKKVFFSRGLIAFAASNIIDDRLGEVIYREAKITLDELTNSAAQVTKARKFGQVLISSSIFSNVQLWAALKLQVRQVLRSLFMAESIYVEMQDGSGLAPTEVVFPETVTELINESHSYGAAFRDFLGKLRADSQVLLTATKDKIPPEFQPGTFVGDLIQLIDSQALVQDLLDASKLIDVYTIAALFQLVNLGLCKLTPDSEDSVKPGPELALLKAKIDAYSYVFEKVRKAFGDAGRDFPIGEIQGFATSLNPEGFRSLYLDSNAELSRDCVGGIYSQCVANHARVSYFAIRLESLIQFLLQVAGDNLDFKVASKIRQDYRSVST